MHRLLHQVITCALLATRVIRSHFNSNSDPEDLGLWKFKLQDSKIDAVTRSTLHTVLFVANEILSERAVLLTHVCRIFTEEYGGEKEELEVGENTVWFTSRWLFNQKT